MEPKVLPVPDLKFTSRASIQPSHPRLTKTTIPLSVVDNSVANYSETGAIWFFSSDIVHNFSEGVNPLSADRVIESLTETLSSYPQLAGQLDFIPESLSHASNPIRLGVTMPGPGVSFHVAESPHPLLSLLPKHPSPCPAIAPPLCSPTLPSLSSFFHPSPTYRLSWDNLTNTTPFHSTQITHTTYQCGSVSLSVKIAHPLADAQSLCTFVHDWSLIHRAISSKIPIPTLGRIFDPSLLSVEGVRSARRELSRRLPLEHLDWWCNPDDCPWDSPARHIPPALQSRFDTGTLPRPESKRRIPWEEWDASRPCIGKIFHFSSEDIEQILQSAIAATINSSNAPSARISRQIALIAHIWCSIVRARALTYHALQSVSLPETQTLNLTLSLRPRVDPKVPQDFLGSPIVNSAIKASTIGLSSPSPSQSAHSETARLVQNAVNQFDDPSAINAMLAEMNAEPCPWRLWDAFLGRARVLCTSWIGSGVSEIDFGVGKADRVLPLMPACQGLVVVMESIDEGQGKEKEQAESGKWYDRGVDVVLFEEMDVMERLTKEDTWQ
ncbi:MAG: hypothetical protein Q9227_001996 [Pyrenula ochraceoflavens]